MKKKSDVIGIVLCYLLFLTIFNLMPKTAYSQAEANQELETNEVKNEISGTNKSTANVIEGKNARIKSSAVFVYEEASDTSAVNGFLKRNIRVKILEKKVNDKEESWLKVEKSGSSTPVAGWVNGIHLEEVGEESPKNKVDTLAEANISKVSRKERMQYVKAHPHLSREIQKKVLNGFIGLEMTFDDVEATWGKADAKKVVILLNRGQIPIWIYNLDAPVIVVFENGKVSGWSKD